jgi:periplasmic protein TonB
MFSALESTWDQSARRGWTTLASFTMQALGLSLLLLIPILTIQGPPKLESFEEPTLAPPPAPAPPTSGQRQIHSSNMSLGQLVEPTAIPTTIANLNEPQVGLAPDLDNIGVQGGIGTGRRGIPGSINIAVEVAPPLTPAPTHPLKISHWAEGNIIYRLQPIYPSLARQARVQGAVELRAIISRTGTIENLVVVRGHPMLATAAIEAVRQWRYRPYLLNNEPIEVETEITVNFVLSGS